MFTHKALFSVLCMSALSAAALWGAAGCSRPSDEVVVGSAFLEGLVEDIGGMEVSVRNLVPGGMCPGHFDIRPSDVETLAACQLLIIHPFQREMANVTQAVEAAALAPERVRVVEVDGSWMVPSVYAEAVARVAGILSGIRPEAAAAYEQHVVARQEQVTARGRELKGRFEDAGVGGVPVLCNSMQAPFLLWAGFKIVGTFGRPEELSVAALANLVHQGMANDVALVIDNLQSGDTRVSETLARDIGAVQVVLSNFPGGFANTDTWDAAVEANADRLVAALGEWRRKHG